MHFVEAKDGRDDRPWYDWMEVKMSNKPDVMLWLSDARGVYIPRDFAASFKDIALSISGVSPEDWAILEDPDHEWYWDTWDTVCDNAIVTDENGDKYRVYQDGDCWLIPAGMEWNDEKDFFDYPSKNEECGL